MKDEKVIMDILANFAPGSVEVGDTISRIGTTRLSRLLRRVGLRHFAGRFDKEEIVGKVVEVLGPAEIKLDNGVVYRWFNNYAGEVSHER